MLNIVLSAVAFYLALFVWRPKVAAILAFSGNIAFGIKIVSNSSTTYGDSIDLDPLYFYIPLLCLLFAWPLLKSTAKTAKALFRSLSNTEQFLTLAHVVVSVLSAFIALLYFS